MSSGSSSGSYNEVSPFSHPCAFPISEHSNSHQQTPDDKNGLLFVRVGSIYGGYDPEFFQETMEDHFVCPICKGVLSSPTLIVECGHVFCEKCINENNRHFHRDTRVPKCPMDNVTLQTDLIQERFLSRYLLQKSVFCPLKKRSCTWEGELSEINDHVENCLYFRVICKSGCGTVLQRKDMLHHTKEICPNRKFKCRYCKDELLFRDIEEHNLECFYFPVQCINQCGIYLERKNLQYHLETECPETSIECTYSKFGCDFRSPRKGMTDHLKQKLELHLCCILNYTGNLEKICVNLHSKYAHLEQKLDMLSRLNSTSYEDGVFTPQTHDIKQEHKTLYNSMDDVSNIAENGSIGYSLIPGLTGGQYTSLCPQNSTDYRGLNVSMRMSDVSISHHSMPIPDGVISFTWHIYDVEEKMQNEEEVFSDAFYSGPEGYKFCLSADMNGYESGEGTHLSVFIHMMKGSNDHNVPWPFKGKFTVTLLNQLENDRHHSIEIQAGEANINAFRCPEQSRGTHGWGSHEFIAHDELKISTVNCQYMKDDSIHIRVTAEPDVKLPYWLW